MSVCLFVIDHWGIADERARLHDVLGHGGGSRLGNLCHDLNRSWFVVLDSWLDREVVGWDRW